jgi:glycosyltransferase 2 family protein
MHKIVTIARWLIPLAIVAFLIFDISRQQSWAEVWAGPKDWPLLALSFALYMIAQLLTIVRWYWLVRALDVPFRWNDAVRLGFLGYLLTFVSLGAVGGDLLKAFFVAREQPGRRVQAFATVIVDRVIGLYALFLLASIAIVTSALSGAPTTPVIAAIYQTVLVCTAAASIGFVVLLVVAGPRGKRLTDWLGHLPKVGAILRPLAGAMQMYRRRLGVVLVSVLLGIVVQSLMIATVWAAGAALVSDPPSLARHTVIVPVAMLTALLPLPGFGLGALEFALEYLYRHVAGASVGQGLLAALGFRLVTVATALVSAVVYVANRREVSEVLHQAEIAETEGIGANA